jgi:hypothetical protein
MKGGALYAAILVATVAGVGWILSRVFEGPADGDAILLSGVVVVVVQLVGFAAVRLLGHRHVMVGWGVAAALRLVTLVLYSVLVAKVLGLPLVAAVLSMAIFFFLTTLVEPLLLRL